MTPSLMLFLIMYLLSFMMVLSCQDWFLIWFGLEINMICFILLMYKHSDLMAIESCLKYFFVQGLGSAIFMSLFYFKSGMMTILASMVLTYKLGGGPFYFWFPSVCDGIDWMMCFMLMSFQKVLPLVVMMLVVNSFLWIMILVSLVVGVMGSFSQSSVKRLFAYSSIHHIGWLILCQVEKLGLWVYYLIIYTLVLVGVVWIMAEESVVSIMDLMGVDNKWMMVFGMLNIGGMPPLLGFFLKWWALMSFMSCDLTILVFMIMLSVVMFYVYLRLMFDVVMGFKVERNWMVNYHYKSKSVDSVGMMGVMLGLFGGVMISLL